MQPSNYHSIELYAILITLQEALKTALPYQFRTILVQSSKKNIPNYNSMMDWTDWTTNDYPHLTIIHRHNWSLLKIVEIMRVRHL